MRLCAPCSRQWQTVRWARIGNVCPAYRRCRGFGCGNSRIASRPALYRAKTPRGFSRRRYLGAQAQGFAPTGDTSSAIHNSSVDFLKKAEFVYFARKKQKKEQGWAKQRGGYQLSGGRVFPTKHNSGLDGYALRKEQEEFFERRLAAGTDPDILRGQAMEAGASNVVRKDRVNRLEDAELEQSITGRD